MRQCAFKKKKKKLHVAIVFSNTMTKVSKVPEGASKCAENTGFTVFHLQFNLKN